MISHCISRPTPSQHIVQFYAAGAEVLVSNVSRYISDAFRDGESAIVVATADHTRQFRNGLAHASIDVGTAEKEKRLVFLDAHATMARFISDGQPDWTRFESTIEEAIRQLAPGSGVRAYGEMVGVLWQGGQFSAAIVLEEYWNRYLGSRDFPLFCSYPIDVFDPEFQMCGVESLLCDHAHVVSSGDPEALASAVNHAVDEHLGPAAADVHSRALAASRPFWASLPQAEATILWLRSNAPEHAEPIVRSAKQYYLAATA